MTKRKNRNPKAAIFCFVWNGRDAINRVSTRLFREFASRKAFYDKLARGMSFKKAMAEEDYFVDDDHDENGQV